MTNNTSNRHPEHVINNAFIRIQVADEKEEGKEKRRQVDSTISKLHAPMKIDVKNSVVP